MRTINKHNSETTRLLCASVYRDVSSIRSIIESRKTGGFFKAETPELYIDIDRIVRECSTAEKRIKSHKWSISALAIIGGIILVPCYYAGAWVITLASISLFVSAFVIIAIFDLKTNKIIRGILLEPSQKTEDSHDSEDCDPEQNILVYGGYSPFVGSGYDISGLSFVVDLAKPSTPGQPPKELELEDFYESIKSSIAALNIPELRFQDILVAHGTVIRDNIDFLPSVLSRPKSVGDEKLIMRYIGLNSEDVRHYNNIRIPAWKGQVVFNVFFRGALIEKQLFFEAHFFILPPLNDNFLKQQNIANKTTSTQKKQIIIESFFKTAFVLLGALFYPLGRFIDYLSQRQNSRKKEEKVVRNNEQFNYGSMGSLRELCSQNSYENFFQELDKNMYMKIIEGRLLDSIVELLQDKGISTESLKEQGAVILNEGVIISGGSINAKTFSVGKGAASVSNG